MSPENKLPEDFKKKWVAALRSGEYKQCFGTIEQDGAYCCIGVAAMVYNGKVVRGHGGAADPDSSYNNLPKAIAGGFRNAVAKTLIRMNDTEERSFQEIADYIEANL